MHESGHGPSRELFMGRNGKTSAENLRIG